MVRLAMVKNTPIPRLARRGILPFLLAFATMVAACGGAKQNAGPDSSPAAASSSSSGSTGTAGSPFEGSVTAKLFGGDQAREIRYAIKGTKARSEAPLSAGGTQTGVMLLDLSSNLQTLLIPQTKTYMTVDLKQAAESMAKAVGQENAAENFKATSTGKTETVAGVSCEHWILGEKQKTDVCLARGMGYFGFGGQSGGVFELLKNLPMGDKMKSQLDANPEFAKFVEGGAFPLKIAQIENGQSRPVLEVTSIERKPMDDSLFAVPSDYRKMEIPGMPATKP
jgi:hypothetical protein